MKNSGLKHIAIIIIITISFTFLNACSDNNDDIGNNDIEKNDISNDLPNGILTDMDEAALLFMLEEEKLARDTYTYLNNLWSIKQFANITKSEQTHMDAIESLLTQNKIEYAILPVGEFKNEDLQSLYNQFVIDGAVDKVSAFKIGATIEDLDIVDLQDRIDATKNAAISSVFQRLQCGSRNHLRSFVSGLGKVGGTYSPQFLTQAAYDTIVSGSNEKCN